MVVQLVPGGGFVQETLTTEELIPGVGFVNESYSSGSAGEGSATIAWYVIN